jgi:hypothetical protein
MSLFSKSEQGNIIIFMDKQKGRLFSIGAMEEREFRLYSLLAYARWNPILLFLKIISLPRPPLSADGMIVSVKEIVFPEGILFLKLFDGSDGRTYEYMLCRRDIFFTGMISGNRNDDFVSERTALELISLIAQ